MKILKLISIKPKSFQNYNNETYCHETIEIKNNNKVCNDTEHFFLDPEWQRLINKKNMCRGEEVKEDRK